MTISQYTSVKHHIAVDCVIFGYENQTLQILLFQRKMTPGEGEWSLLGGWVGEEETMEQAASRVLLQTTGLKDVYMEQVHVFSELNRDPGGRVVSLVFFAMMRIDKHDRDLVEAHGASWFPLDSKPALIFDHDRMVEAAHEKLKQKASHELIGEDLLPSRFTLFQLRRLYDAIFQRKFDPGNFRKKVLSLKILERLNDKNTTDSKKGAYYFRFKKRSETLLRDRIVKM